MSGDEKSLRALKIRLSAKSPYIKEFKG